MSSAIKADDPAAPVRGTNGQHTVRFPIPVYEALVAQANRNLRSVAAEVVAIVTGVSDAVRVDG